MKCMQYGAGVGDWPKQKISPSVFADNHGESLQ